MIFIPGLTPTHISSSPHALEPHPKTPGTGHSHGVWSVPLKLLSRMYEQGAWDTQVTLGPAGRAQPTCTASRCPCLSLPVPVPHTEPSGEVPGQGMWKDAPNTQRGQEPFLRPGLICTKEEMESKYWELIFLSGRGVLVAKNEETPYSCSLWLRKVIVRKGGGGAFCALGRD